MHTEAIIDDSVLVLKAPPGLSVPPSDYPFEHAFPITDGLSISMAQSPLTGLDRMTQPDRTNPAEAGFSVKIVLGDNRTSEPLTLWTRDLDGLKSLLEVYRRHKANSALRGDGQDYSWLAAYIGRPSRPAILSTVPPDLRTLQKPVHMVLSSASAGLPGDEALDIAVIREDWMRRRVRSHLLFGAERRSSLRVHVGTFNVNGKMPAQDLSPWLRDDSLHEHFIPPLKEISPLSLETLAQGPLGTGTVLPSLGKVCAQSAPRCRYREGSSTGAERVDKVHVSEKHGDSDLFVLAFQELDLSTEALLYSTKTVREDAWCDAIFAGLGEKAVLYEKLASKQLVGMLLIVIVRKRLRRCFKEVRSASIGAGIMGMMGNKGATAVRLTYSPPSTDGGACRPCTLTFVNSHLAAFDEMFDRRNADFHDISKRLLFDSGMSSPEPQTQDDVTSEDITMTLNVFETDAIFWMIDLNYRLNLPDADVRHLLSSPRELRRPNMGLMLKFDQLLLARHLRKAFEDFKEHPISHAPSYRFASGMMGHPLGYDMKRKPAWTDRILHMHSEMLDVDQSSYTSHDVISMSDHKPVSAGFDIRVAALNDATFEAFVQDLWREVGSIEGSEEVPRLQIETTFIDIGPFSARKPVRKDLHVQNIGKIPCTFRFVAAQPGSGILPEWLEVDQASGLLLPGEATVLKMSTRADNALTSKLNLSKANLQDTLILHTALGKDHFITISALYERTCFCTGLHILARLPGPIRALGSLSELLPADHAVTAPREIMRIVNWIMANASNVNELFLANGDNKLFNTICECLDTGADFPLPGAEKEAETALAFGDVLIRFLGLLPDPIIPASLVARCAEVTNKDDAFQILEELPAVNLNVWISTTAVLHYIAQQCTAKNRIEQLVAVFTSVLLPDEPTVFTSPSVSILGKRAFLRYFIL
ncbi:DNase I-like protein [Fomitopsis betulina]|nr:DNase I-like protein [Fomitopsis betulina]